MAKDTKEKKEKHKKRNRDDDDEERARERAQKLVRAAELGASPQQPVLQECIADLICMSRTA